MDDDPESAWPELSVVPEPTVPAAAVFVTSGCSAGSNIQTLARATPARARPGVARFINSLMMGSYQPNRSEWIWSRGTPARSSSRHTRS